MFNIGDKVLANYPSDGNKKIVGQSGTILHIGHSILVEFEVFVEGHDGQGTGDRAGKFGNCWWVKPEHLEKSDGTISNIKDRIQKRCEHLYKV